MIANRLAQSGVSCIEALGVNKLARDLVRRHQGTVCGPERVHIGTYRYYLTRAGRAAIAAGRRLTEHTIIPALA